MSTNLIFLELESNRSLLLADDLNLPLFGSSLIAEQSFSFYSVNLLLRLSFPEEEISGDFPFSKSLVTPEYFTNLLGVTRISRFELWLLRSSLGQVLVLLRGLWTFEYVYEFCLIGYNICYLSLGFY